MNDLDKIEHALRNTVMHHATFERFAQDTLSTVYPGLTPIPGGTDWGRDADIAIDSGDAAPPRLLVTSARTLNGVRKNMLRSIKSLRDHGVPTGRLVLANAASLTGLNRHGLTRSAATAGAQLDVSDIFDRGFFASRLRRDGYWRETLLGLPSGPITLSRTAPDLAESPWSFLPLVARNDDRAALAGDDDLILTGPPGVGKSRLASDLEGVAFVDTDADPEQVASDLRWALPSVLVVDDAADDDERLIRRLLSLRSTEPGLFGYRIVCVCWPDGIDALRALLPAARVHAVDLLERAPLDTLLQQTGITGALPRREILDQAEGRPGWAISLADLLLRSQDATSLLNGRALLGHVDRYMRRAGVDPDAIDILALVAALGEVTDAELPRLATEAAVRRSTVAAVLTDAAHSGLIDVQQRRDDHGDPVRVYSVRPPMLADVLVAERAFDAPAPMLDIVGLAERWPDRAVALTRAAIEASVLGAAGARARADRLLNAVLADPATSHPVKVDLSHRFLRLDKAAAAWVVKIARSSFDEAVAAGDADGWRVEPVVKLAAAAVRGYADPDAMALLFDACLVDQRPTNLNPAHPRRQVADLVTSFHPELPLSVDLRFALAAVLLRWDSAAPRSPEREQAAAAILSALLAIRLRSAQSDPGSPLTVQLIETVLPAAQMHRVFDQLWPVAAELLDRGNPAVPGVLLTVAEDWLRIGGGFDRPFGQNHPADAVAAAGQIGQQLLAALAARDDLSLGARSRLQALAARHGLTAPVELPAELEPFLRDIKRAGADWRELEKTLADDVQQTARGWVSEPPEQVVARLTDLREQIAQAGVRWPDRIAMALLALAEEVDQPLDWAMACQQQGLMPDGMPFVAQALRQVQLTPERATAFLSDPLLRVSMLHLLLTSATAPPWALELVIGAVTTEDFRLVETLLLRQELSEAQLTALLTRPAPPVRALVAVALLISNLYDNAEWSPGTLEQVWRQALDGLEPAQLPLLPQYDLSLAVTYLAPRYPTAITGLVERAMVQAGESSSYQALPHDTWELLHLLPAEVKTALWRTFKDSSWRAYLLLGYLSGPDVGWVVQLITDGDLAPNQATSCFRGLAPRRPSTRDLAEALVPLGVDPEDIASLRFSGSWSGPQSDRYQRLVEEFSQMLTDDSDAVRRVGEAGVPMFTGAKDRAAERERQQRIRGER